MVWASEKINGKQKLLKKCKVRMSVIGACVDVSVDECECGRDVPGWIPCYLHHW